MVGSPAPHLHWTDAARINDLESPILIAAFEGWNDAGEASSTAARYVRDHFESVEVASIDAEDFFDFTVARPSVHLDDDGRRHIAWPSTSVYAAHIPGTGHDLVVLTGHEPQLRWRTFVDHVVTTANEVGASLAVTLGALLTDIPHTRPVQVYGTSDDEAIAEHLSLSPSTYEGPTGIVGVLGTGLRAAGIPTASLWASVPAYVSSAPSPKAALALVESLGTVLGTTIPCTDLEIAAAAYERQVSELVAEDDDTAEYVERLEVDFDEEPDDNPDRLVADIEDFLRNQPGKP
ncbi:MAG TPA: PAC2 family protein [Acidimicrobiales bacterium]|nr:PAC2 family protein [Acidimicrobiales bacterium]MDP6176512.1 PAC2 family protein [Acidimicrobiales bacterium]HJL90519.1 PAC2 family protein [Acidimicrobiales bacterium]HJO99181.1 PAC2 family protein [Acidimicrobiales bacterium]